jgi:hypothetical protein
MQLGKTTPSYSQLPWSCLLCSISCSLLLAAIRTSTLSYETTQSGPCCTARDAADAQHRHSIQRSTVLQSNCQASRHIPATHQAFSCMHLTMHHSKAHNLHGLGFFTPRQLSRTNILAATQSCTQQTLACKQYLSCTCRASEHASCKNLVLWVQHGCL